MTAFQPGCKSNTSPAGPHHIPRCIYEAVSLDSNPDFATRCPARWGLACSDPRMLDDGSQALGRRQCEYERLPRAALRSDKNYRLFTAGIGKNQNFRPNFGRAKKLRPVRRPDAYSVTFIVATV
jgi:hypothetical protein